MEGGIKSCKHCDFTTKFQAYLREHMHKKHKDQMMAMQCDLCDYATDTSFALNAHKRKRHTESCVNPTPEQGAKACPHCDYSSKNSWVLKNHIQMVHENLHRFVCNVCGQAFKKKNSLKLHKENNHPQDEVDQMEMPMDQDMSYEGGVYEGGEEGVASVMEAEEEYYYEATPQIPTLPLPLPPALGGTPTGIPVGGGGGGTPNVTPGGGAEGGVTCEHCFRVFKNKENLGTHMLRNCPVMSKATKAFPCNKCDFSTFTVRGLSVHIQKKHSGEDDAIEIAGPSTSAAPPPLVPNLSYKEDLFKCDSCDYVCNDELMLQGHISSVHEHEGQMPVAVARHSDEPSQPIPEVQPSADGRYHCDRCEYSSSTGVGIKVHLNKKHGLGNPRPWKCKYCPKTYETKITLMVHMRRSCAGSNHLKGFSCTVCSFSTFTQAGLNNHMSSKHPGVEIPVGPADFDPTMADIAEPEVGQPDQMYQGQEEEPYFDPSQMAEAYYDDGQGQEGQEYYYPEEGQFQPQQGQEMDLEREEEEIPHQIACDKCDFACGNEIELKRHIRSAHAKKFKCNKCEKSFNQVSTLEQHKAFAHNPSKVQQQIQGNNKKKDPFGCKHCGVSFSTAVGLKVHLHKKHTGDAIPKRWKCKNCGNRYQNKGALLLHMRSRCKNDQGMARVFCELCDFSTITVNGMKSHYSKAHGTSYNPPEGSDLPAPDDISPEGEDADFLEENVDDHVIESQEELEAQLQLELEGEPEIAEPPIDTFSSKSNIAFRLHQNTEQEEEEEMLNPMSLLQQDFQDGDGDGSRLKCQHCSIDFKSSRTLRHHVLSKHSDQFRNKFPCEFCSFATDNSKSLSMHYSHVHKDQPKPKFSSNEVVIEVQCDICDVTMSSPDLLRMHKEAVHSEFLNEVTKKSLEPIQMIKDSCIVDGEEVEFYDVLMPED